MTTYVALLRGINVGGRNVVKMSDLRPAMEDAGAEDVVTYIQSGNVVFDHPERDVVALTARLERQVATAAGFHVPVVLRTASQWRAVEASNPFPGADPAKLHVLFLPTPLPPGAFSAIDAAAYEPERLVVKEQEVYYLLPNGLGRSKLAAARPASGTPEGTMRNWNTVVKLRELSTR